MFPGFPPFRKYGKATIFSELSTMSDYGLKIVFGFCSFLGNMTKGKIVPEKCLLVCEQTR